jgi:DNA helicase-2/ATP-dependent DNA helicase PcrA
MPPKRHFTVQPPIAPGGSYRRPRKLDLPVFLALYEKAIGHPLDNAQRDAIVHGPGPLFILAGPGSGKSEVIVARALKLTLVDGVAPRSIFMTTFTDKAARNLEDRVADRLSRIAPEFQLDELTVGTLHSLCDRIMRDFRYQVYHDTRLLDNIEQSFFVHRELHDWLKGVDRKFWDSVRFLHPMASNAFGPSSWQKVESFKRLINRVTEDEVSVEALRKSGDAAFQVLADGIELYRQRLVERSRSDFAHVQLSFLEFLKSRVGATFLKGDGRRGVPPLKYVLVDEYQDTNPIQESIYFALASAAGGNISVVGDDDQALYRFRGGTVECLVRFPEKCKTVLHKLTKTVQLQTNYRSYSEITDWCERIIHAQPEMGRPGARAVGKKPMLSDRGAAPGHRVMFSIEGEKYATAGAAAAAVISEMIHESKVSDPAEIAILMKSTRESPRNAGPVVTELRRLNIPVYNPRSKSFKQAEEVAAMIGGLVRIADHDLRFADSLGERGRDALDTWVAAWDAIAGPGTPLDEYYQKVRNQLSKKPLGVFLKFGLLDAFYRVASRKPFSEWEEDAERTYRLGLLSAVLESYVSVEGGHSFKTSSRETGRFSEGWLRGSFYPRLLGYLHSTELDDPEDLDYEIVRGKVQVMTVHQAKGLEFPIVFVDSLDLSNDSADATYVLEERLGKLSSNRRLMGPAEERCVQDSVRFFYVAYSRAQDLLCLFGTTKVFGRSTVSLGRVGTGGR